MKVVSVIAQIGGGKTTLSRATACPATAAGLRDAQVYCAGACLPAPIVVAVTVVDALQAAFAGCRAPAFLRLQRYEALRH